MIPGFPTKDLLTISVSAPPVEDHRCARDRAAADPMKGEGPASRPLLNQGLSSSKPNGTDGEIDGYQKGARCLVVAGGNSAKPPEFGEEVLEQVPAL
jgi:hypothetical protein